MVNFGFFKKKAKKEEELDLDSTFSPDGRLDIPSPPSPTSPTASDFPDFPNYSDEQQKVVLPPVLGEEKPELPEQESAGEKFGELDSSWKEFAKLGAEPETEVKAEAPAAAVPEVKARVQKEVKAEERKAEPKPIKPMTESPLFIEVDTYSTFLDEISRLRIKLQLLDGIVTKIDNMREKEETELNKWHQNIDDIRKKLLFIDDAIFESRG